MKIHLFGPACALACGLFLIFPASAATYIVDNQNPRAADTNPGTQMAPLKTINAAAKLAQAGDEVVVRPGTYRESVVLNNSGTEGKPIVFRSEVPRAAIISGSDLVTDWKPEGPGIWSMAAPDLTFNKWGNPEWVYINGYPLQNADSRSLVAPGTFFLDFDHKRVFVAPEEGQDITKQRVEYAHRDGLMAPSVDPRFSTGGMTQNMKQLDDIHILGFTLLHNADAYRAKRAIIATGRRWHIEGNRIAWASYNGLGIWYTNGCVVRDNLIEWTGNAAIGGVNNINMLVENNRFLYSNWRRIRPSFEGGVSKWVHTYDSLIRGNEVAYYYGSGLWTDIANSGNIYENNVVHDSTGGIGLFTEISWGDVFRNNVAYNNDIGITIGESPNSAALRNVVFNNGTGIRLRGNYRREMPAPEIRPAETEKFLADLNRIPDMPAARLAQLEAAYLTYWRAPKFYFSTNALIWNNLMFDNGANYTEQRNYAVQSPDDPFINNFSDYNLFYNADPDANVRHNTGGYGDLAGWQKVSGRDAHSTIVNPHDSQAVLPDWASARRTLWEGLKHTPGEIKALKLGLIETPSASLLMARLMNSPAIRVMPLKDTKVRACLFDLDGQKTLAVWTTQLSDRRYIRFKTGQTNITLENGYGGQTSKPLENGALDVVATYVPTYLRGVGDSVTEASATTLSAQSFNAPNKAVSVTANIVNDAAQPRHLVATFSASPGFKAVPQQVVKTVAPGQSIQVTTSLEPDGSFLRGSAQARMQATLGTESLTRTSAFVVGEGGGTIPALAQPLRIDGDLADWRQLGESAQLGVITDAAQITQGSAATWGGPKNLSARIYSTWRKDALYVAVSVTDDTVIPAPSGGSAWDADAVEVFVDGRSSEMQWQKDVTEGVAQIGVSPTGDKPTPTILSKSPITGVTAGAMRNSGGYTIEIRIPLTPENFPAGEWNSGRPVKISVLVDDKDNPTGDRDTVMGWSFSPGGKNFSDTSGWKTVILE